MLGLPYDGSTYKSLESKLKGTVEKLGSVFYGSTLPPGTSTSTGAGATKKPPLSYGKDGGARAAASQRPPAGSFWLGQVSITVKSHYPLRRTEDRQVATNDSTVST
jgi:hypothetical protein